MFYYMSKLSGDTFMTIRLHFVFDVKMFVNMDFVPMKRFADIPNTEQFVKHRQPRAIPLSSSQLF